MEVKLLIFFKGQLWIIQRIVWFWMSVMIQEWNNSWIANTVILYFPNQISKEPIGIQLFYVKSRRQNLEFVIQVLIFFFFFIWNELKLEDFEKKVNCKAKVKFLDNSSKQKTWKFQAKFQFLKPLRMVLDVVSTHSWIMIWFDIFSSFFWNSLYDRIQECVVKVKGLCFGRPSIETSLKLQAFGKNWRELGILKTIFIVRSATSV